MTGKRQLRPMKKRYPVHALLLVALVASCATPRPRTMTTRLLTSEEKTALAKRGKPPQVFGLTAYSSDQGPVFAGAFRQHQGHIGRVGLAAEKDTTTPVIGINGGIALLLIDSTAAESWLTVEASVALKTVALTGTSPFEKTAGHVQDDTGGFAAVLPKMILENLHVENGVFYVRNAEGPLEALTRWEKTPYLDGVLGADFLRAFQFVRISLRGRNLVFSATDPYPNSDQILARIPLSDFRGGLAAEAMFDGEKLTALIDLAGDFESAMETPPGKKLRQVTLGDIVFRQVEVESTDDLGLGTDSPPRIGRQLLERFDLVINNRGTELIIERPAQTSGPTTRRPDPGRPATDQPILLK
jgi:hypothetical protein